MLQPTLPCGLRVYPTTRTTRGGTCSRARVAVRSRSPPRKTELRRVASRLSLRSRRGRVVSARGAPLLLCSPPRRDPTSTSVPAAAPAPDPRPDRATVRGGARRGAPAPLGPATSHMLPARGAPADTPRNAK